MLNLSELEQLIAFADFGTLSKAAEELHVSQPTVTRTMKSIEEEFGVPLFIRGKNRIELNETGLKAVEYARSLLVSAQNAVLEVKNFHAKLHTIAVESCAPAPLWTLLPLLSSRFPEQTISSKLSELSEIADHVAAGVCEIGIVTYPVPTDGFICVPIVRENLFVCIPSGHELASREDLTLEDLNGFNCLLASEIGFWMDLCRQKMPASRFIIQTDSFAMRELTQKSSLPCFTTNLAGDRSDILRGRNIIPITNPEANVTYYFICKKSDTKYAAMAEHLKMQYFD